MERWSIMVVQQIETNGTVRGHDSVFHAQVPNGQIAEYLGGLQHRVSKNNGLVLYTIFALPRE